MSAVEKSKSTEISSNRNSCESIARVEKKLDCTELITEDTYKCDTSENDMILANSNQIEMNAGNEDVPKVTEICVPVDKDSEAVKTAEQTSCRPSTSSALMYSEYMNTSAPVADRIFERKTKKPVILSYGESPMYKKYSDLLKKLQESKDEYPTGWGKKFPIIQIHLLLKRKAEDDDSDSEEEEDSRMVLYGSKKEGHDSSSSDEDDTSDEDNEESAKTRAKIEVLSENEDSQSSEQKDKSDVENKVIQSVLCNIIEECVPPVSDSSAEMSSSQYDHAPKKLRLD